MENMEMDVLDLLRVIEEEVEHASSIPLSGKKMIDGQLVLDVISDIRLALPRQMQEAKNIMNTRDQILQEAKKDAEDIEKGAKIRADELVQNNMVMVEVREKAHDLTMSAQKNAEEIREGAEAYAEDILNDLLRYLDDYKKIIEKNRGELDNRKK